MGTLKNIFEGTLLFIVVLFTGTYSISVTEGVTLFEAFYHIFLTITTVGGHIPTLTIPGRIITMGSVFLGMGSVIYIGTLMAKTVIEGQTRLFLTGFRGGIIRMKKMKNHIIVCGYGQLGKYVTQTLKQAKHKFIIIERDQERATQLLEAGLEIIQGDALEPSVLKKAQIDNAKAIIGTLGTDADNIYLMMTASDINPQVTLAAEARDENAVKRLHKIGAQIVVLPKIVGGRQLANAVIELEKTQNLSTISEGKTN